MSYKRQLNALYKIGVLSLVVAMVWILMGIYTAMVKETKVNVDKKILAPFSPTLNEQALQQFLQRGNY